MNKHIERKANEVYQINGQHGNDEVKQRKEVFYEDDRIILGRHKPSETTLEQKIKEKERIFPKKHLEVEDQVRRIKPICGITAEITSPKQRKY